MGVTMALAWHFVVAEVTNIAFDAGAERGAGRRRLSVLSSDMTIQAAQLSAHHLVHGLCESQVI
jgi:hypothetical protein